MPKFGRLIEIKMFFFIYFYEQISQNAIRFTHVFIFISCDTKFSLQTVKGATVAEINKRIFNVHMFCHMKKNIRSLDDGGGYHNSVAWELLPVKIEVLV